ncbi:MAG: hypothetical protein H0W66_12525, partial [Chthoniobacterales bacterium]|nr:hypothetical protein [Chthoniobacterales bacterium]
VALVFAAVFPFFFPEGLAVALRFVFLDGVGVVSSSSSSADFFFLAEGVLLGLGEGVGFFFLTWEVNVDFFFGLGVGVGEVSACAQPSRPTSKTSRIDSTARPRTGMAVPVTFK